MSRDGDSFDTVVKALAADCAREFGAEHADILALERVDGPFSRVQRVCIRTPSGNRYAYVKVFTPRGSGPDESARVERFLRREYRATSALHQALEADADITAVRPIAIRPDLRALVTEEVPGRPFGELLTDERTPTGDLLKIAGRVGKWIRRYQMVSERAGEISLAERRAYLATRLDRLHRVLPVEERDGTLATVDALSRRIGTSSIPAVRIHADLTPMNIMVCDDGRVAVLDFTMVKAGTALHDLTHVHFHLGLMAARTPRRRPLLHALQHAAISGFDTSVTTDDPLFRLMLIQHGVCHVAQLAERRVPVFDAMCRWYLRRRWRVCQEIAAGMGREGAQGRSTVLALDP